MKDRQSVTRFLRECFFSWIDVLFVPVMWVLVVLNNFLKTHRKICRLSLFYRSQRHWRQLRDVIDTGEQFTIHSKALLNLSKTDKRLCYDSLSKRILMTLVRDWKTLKICMCLFGWWKTHRTEKSHGTLPVNILILVVKKLIAISYCWFSRWPTFFNKIECGWQDSLFPQPLTLKLSKTIKIFSTNTPYSENKVKPRKKDHGIRISKEEHAFLLSFKLAPRISSHIRNCYLLRLLCQLTQP